MKMIKDRKYAVVMMIMSVIYGYSAFTLDSDFDPTNEKFYPLILSLAMLLMSIGLFINPTDIKPAWPKGRNVLNILSVFIAILVYSLVLEKVGFLICASILMAVCMWVFDADRKWIAPVSVTVAVSFYMIFDRLLGLNLPAGLLNFF